MSNNITIGQIGEELACAYLLKNKYKIIDRNARYSWGEIDIVAQKKDGTLVFVEVKALKMFHSAVKQPEIGAVPLEINHLNTADKISIGEQQSSSGSGLVPEDNLSWSKLNKVKRTASLYANSHSDLIDENRGWQIDLIAIEIHPRTQSLGEGVNHQNPENISAKELLKFCQIRHYENI
jgi:Holliday junction resolvase-like predicted endonuclease